MEYPKHHRLIVEDLLSGKFLLRNEDHFQSLKENEDFYIEFFKISFNYDLKVTGDFAYLISPDSNETFSRDVSIFFAILCYELDRDGKNFMDQIQYGEFEIDNIERYFEETTFNDIIRNNKQLKDRESRKNLINAMARKNIIEKTAEDRFMFTPAYHVFIDFAKELAKEKMDNINE